MTTTTTDRPGDADAVARLRPITRRLREHVIRMITAAGSGHPGGSLSAAEILTVLFFRTLRRRPGDPTWPDRDRFLISKGHGVPILYAALAEAGELPAAELLTLRKLGSRLQGHPDRVQLPWVEAATGSLGQGLSLALGMALASRLDGTRYRVFCLLGDGESQAGQVWEAAMAAGKYRVDNLVAILDYNKVQLDGAVPAIMDLEPLVDKWRSFNWQVRVIADGNDLGQVVDALDAAGAAAGRAGAPQLVLAHTVKGKGVSFMEGTAAWHGKAPTAEEAARALEEIAAHG
jgi:transketolase